MLGEQHARLSEEGWLKLTEHKLINSERLLNRFLSYVKVGTSADGASAEYPSTKGQLKLGQLLLSEMRSFGLFEARQDEFGLVWALVPGNVPNAPTILLNAHLDTSPEAAGDNVRPQVIRDYRGGDIPLSHPGAVIRVSDCVELNELIGHTLVTTDGTTLLGGDDKAGVAVIMELAQHLIEHPEIPHGPVQVLFTCDEEIGRGTSKIAMDQLGAVAGYTLDGSGAGELEGENFSADELAVQVNGHNIHPSIGKGRMVNAVRAAAKLIDSLPLDKFSPESTDGKDGFLHPYSSVGGVGSVAVRILLRDFQTAKLDDYAQMVETRARQIEAEMPGVRFDIQRHRQYRNMAEFMKDRPLVMDLAEQAFAKLGRPCIRGSIRGGTDGAMLSEKGLPTPNLSVGQHNIHSVLEFVSLDEMVAAAEHLVALLDLWQQHGRS